ncbi:PEP-CTERM sorting domain-containing protein [Marinobacter algicola]|uniref:PEP-CTERM sorting domain-containing protein n=1 Tax=Marinobacter algicola TaxID=236100 RepID=UPI003BAA43FA
MNTLKTVGAIGVLLGACTWAGAAPILNISSQGAAAAAAAELDFLSTAHSGYLTETFDDNTFYTVGSQASTITSSVGVGDFTSAVPGSGGLCDSGPYNCNDGLAVLNASASPFSGRYAISGNNWLDSMDARQMVISPAAGFNSMGFYITDPNDAGGRFSIGGVDFSFNDIFGSALGNGRVYYVSLYDAAGLGDVSIFSNNPDDGYGIDNVTVANVTEPGTLALLALGLLGIGLSLSRKSKRNR